MNLSDSVCTILCIFKVIYWCYMSACYFTIRSQALESSRYLAEGFDYDYICLKYTYYRQ